MRNVLNRKIRWEERKEGVKRWKDSIKTFDLRDNYIDFYDLESERRRKMIDRSYDFTNIRRCFLSLPARELESTKGKPSSNI